MHEKTRHELSARRPISRDPGPLDLTTSPPPRPEVEPLNAAEKMSYLGQTLFAQEEVRLDPPRPLPTFSELVAQAYRTPSPSLQRVLHTMVEMPGLDTAARNFVEEERQWEAGQ